MQEDNDRLARIEGAVASIETRLATIRTLIDAKAEATAVSVLDAATAVSLSTASTSLADIAHRLSGAEATLTIVDRAIAGLQLDADGRIVGFALPTATDPA